MFCGVCCVLVRAMWPLSRPFAAFRGVYYRHPLAPLPSASLGLPGAWLALGWGTAAVPDGRFGVPVPSTPFYAILYKSQVSISAFAEPAGTKLGKRINAIAYDLLSRFAQEYLKNPGAVNVGVTGAAGVEQVRVGAAGFF